MHQHIPMAGIVESLNLGTSSGIVLYEITKQRRIFQDELRAKISAKKREKIDVPNGNFTHYHSSMGET